MKKNLFLFVAVFAVVVFFVAGCKETVLPEEITTTTSLPDYETVQADFYESTNANIDLGEGLTPLMYAVMEGDTNFVSDLLNEGADVNAENDYGFPVLGFTVFNEFEDVEEAEALVELLADAGADLNAEIPMGPGVAYTPISFAAMGANSELVIALAEAGADVNGTNSEGLTPLHIASMYADAAAVQALIDADAEVEPLSAEGATPLFWAVYGDNYGVVEILVNNGAEYRDRSSDGNTPLHLAAHNGNIDIAVYLMTMGADPDANRSDGQRVLHEAIAQGHTQLCKVLISYGADVNKTGIGDMTALHWAIYMENPELVDYILDWSPDFTAEDAEGRTPEDLAEEIGNSDVIAALNGLYVSEDDIQ